MSSSDNHKLQGIAHFRQREFALAMHKLESAVAAASDDWESRYWYVLSIREYALEQFADKLLEHGVDSDRLSVPGDPMEALTASPRIVSEALSRAHGLEASGNVVARSHGSELHCQATSFALVIVKTDLLLRALAYAPHLDAALAANPEHSELSALKTEFQRLSHASDTVSKLIQGDHSASNSEPCSDVRNGAGAIPGYGWVLPCLPIRPCVVVRARRAQR